MSLDSPLPPDATDREGIHAPEMGVTAPEDGRTSAGASASRVLPLTRSGRRGYRRGRVRTVYSSPSEGFRNFRFDAAASSERAIYLTILSRHHERMELTHAKAAATGVLVGPIGTLVGSYLWWHLVKIDCSVGVLQAECVKTAEGTAYSWPQLASQNVSVLFGFVLAGLAVASIEVLIWAQKQHVAAT